MYAERIGLVVWLDSPKQSRHLRKYGVVHYVSKNMNYAILYCDQAEKDTIMENLQSYPFVTKVIPSHKPELETSFSGPLHPRESEERKALLTKPGI